LSARTVTLSPATAAGSCRPPAAVVAVGIVRSTEDTPAAMVTGLLAPADMAVGIARVPTYSIALACSGSDWSQGHRESFTAPGPYELSTQLTTARQTSPNTARPDHACAAWGGHG
jgi:hypothetical protein